MPTLMPTMPIDIIFSDRELLATEHVFVIAAGRSRMVEEDCRAGEHVAGKRIQLPPHRPCAGLRRSNALSCARFTIGTTDLGYR